MADQTDPLGLLTPPKEQDPLGLLSKDVPQDPLGLLPKEEVKSTSGPSILQKTQSALGRAGQEAGRLVTGFASQFSKLAPFDIQYDKETGTVKAKDISPQIEQRRDDLRNHINQFFDTTMHASDADRQPGNIVEKLAYGVVEFMPLAPIYGYVGGPAAGLVEDALANITKRFGPSIANEVATRLPAMLHHAGKYIGDVATEGLKAGAEGMTTELAAGSSPEEAAKTGGAFAVYSMAFKGLLRDPAKALKESLTSGPKFDVSKPSPFEKGSPEDTLHRMDQERMKRYAWQGPKATFEDLQGFDRASAANEQEFAPITHPDWFEDIEKPGEKVEQKMTDLFRGEGVAPIKGTPGGAIEKTQEMRGAWWTTDRSKALEFSKERGGELHHVSLPEKLADQFKEEGLPADERIIPKEVVEKHGIEEVPRGTQNT